MSDTHGSFTFDGDLQVVTVIEGISSFSAAEVYSRWKDWAQTDDNAKYPPAFANSVGGEPLGGGSFVGGYFFIQNGWKIRPQEADHVLVVSGNLFPIPDTAEIFAPTLGMFSVVVSMRTSSLTQKVVVEGSTTVVTGEGAVDPSAVAEAVWAHDVADADSGAGKTLQDAADASQITIGLL